MKRRGSSPTYIRRGDGVGWCKNSYPTDTKRDRLSRTLLTTTGSKVRPGGLQSTEDQKTSERRGYSCSDPTGLSYHSFVYLLSTRLGIFISGNDRGRTSVYVLPRVSSFQFRPGLVVLTNQLDTWVLLVVFCDNKIRRLKTLPHNVSLMIDYVFNYGFCFRILYTVIETHPHH